VVSEDAPTSAEDGEPLPRPAAVSDPVELAIAEALTKATAAGEWTVVAQLARELEARRTAHAGVPSLAEARARRRQ
jgi:hypothetical protein